MSKNNLKNKPRPSTSKGRASAHGAGAGLHAVSGTHGAKLGAHGTKPIVDRASANEKAFASKNRPRAQKPHTPKSRTLDAEAMSIPLEHGEMTITRRQLMYIAGGIFGVVAIGGGAYAFNQVFGEHEIVEDSVSVPTSSVLASTDFQQIEQDMCVGMTGDFKLDFGTMVWCNDDSLAACLVPGETGNPLTKVDLLYFSTGNTETMLEAAAGAAEGFQILDVRATTSGLLWVESDILEQTWRVYTAVLKSDGGLANPVCVDSGDANWELPSIAITENVAFWQVQPESSGNDAKSTTALKRATLGSSNVQVLYESNGHSACAVSATDKYVVIAPRAQSGSSVRYRLTCINAKTGVEVDSLILPSTMKPTNVTYCDTGFAFSFNAIYSNSTGISNIGTYVPITNMTGSTGVSATGVTGSVNTSAVNTSGATEGENVASDTNTSGGTSATNTRAMGATSTTNSASTTTSTSTNNSSAYSSASWFRWARTPVCAPANCGSFLIVKSTTAVCGVNLGAKTYFALDTTTGCEDYGDMLASSGTHKNFVTYSNITTKPLSGDSEQYCQVRVWESL